MARIQLTISRARTVLRFALVIIGILSTGTSKACPFCDTSTSKEIRKFLFGPDLLYNIVATILPFVIFGIIIYLIYRGGFRSSKPLK